MKIGFVNRRSGVQSSQRAPINFLCLLGFLPLLPIGKVGLNGEQQRSYQPQNQDHLFTARFCFSPFPPRVSVVAGPPGNDRIKRPWQPGGLPRPPTQGRFLPVGVLGGRRRKAFNMAAIGVGGSKNNMHVTRRVCTYLKVAVP
jgi:hypothetical protein